MPFTKMGTMAGRAKLEVGNYERSCDHALFEVPLTHTGKGVPWAADCSGLAFTPEDKDLGIERYV